MNSVLEDPVPDPLQHPNYASPSPKRLASTVFGRTDSEALDEGDDEHSDHSKTREEGDKSPSIKLENKPTPECEDLDGECLLYFVFPSVPSNPTRPF